MKRVLLFAVVLTSVAGIFHLAWEYLQCPLFFVHGSAVPTHKTMLTATAGDIALTWIAHGFLSILSRDYFWPLRKWERKHWMMIFLLAIAMSVLIEIWALSAGRWTYTEINPRFPGTEISIVPVLQLLILFPATFGVTQWILGVSLKKSGNEKQNA